MSATSGPIGQIFGQVVANAESSLLDADAWSTLHQRSLELVAADHLVQYQQVPGIDNVLVVLQPISVFDSCADKSFVWPQVSYLMRGIPPGRYGRQRAAPGQRWSATDLPPPRSA